MRLDFARGEAVLARDVASVLKPGARPLAFRQLDSLVTDVAVGGDSARAVIDTGTADGLRRYPRWAGAHGLPGSRPRMKASLGGVGSDEAAAVRFIAPHTTLGAIDLPALRATIGPASTPQDGIVGTPMLAACAAVTFDFAHRTLWLEPPCNRGAPDDRSDMHIEHSDIFTVLPWIVAATLPGASAERAGIRAGDRLLEVSGKRAEADAVLSIAPLFRRAAGTRLPVVVDREGERKKLVMTVWDPP